MRPSKKTIFITLAIILAATGLIRALFLLGEDPDPAHSLPPGMDEVNYRELAANTLDFHRFQAYSEGFLTSSTRAPGYPTLLACLSRLTGRSPFAPWILNLVLEMINSALIFFLAAKLYDAATGWCAAAFHAVFAPCFIYLPMSTPEIASVSLILAICAAASVIANKNNYGKSLVPFAVILAFLIHTRPVFLLVAPVIAVALFLDLKDLPLRRRLAKAAAPLALTGLLCVPWAIRNYQRHQTLIPVCSLAGWHVVSSARNQSELSIDDVMDYVYAPARRHYSEGEYFKEAMRLSLREAGQHPARTLLAGVARIAHAWSPPGPFYRFLLPRAYVMPVTFRDGFWLPFPDFEGFLYACAAGVAAGLALHRRRRARILGWFYRSRTVIIIVAAYASAHVAGIPLTQYRFMIEPVVAILGFGLLRHSVAASPPKRTESFVGVGLTRMLQGLAFILVLAIAIPLAHRDDPSPLPYPTTRELAPEHLDFEQLRDIQWRSLGRVNEPAKADLTGVVKYLTDKRRFVPGTAQAVETEVGTVGKLYVNYRRKGDMMGVGDVKLNFTDAAPENGALIRVRGSVHSGKFRDLIIAVQHWEHVGNRVPAAKQ